MVEKCYWNGTGEEQRKYDEMRESGFPLDKEFAQMIKSYQRYYESGRTPGWAKINQDFVERTSRSGYRLTLNERGEQEQEERMTAAILTEYIRFKRWEKRTER